MTLKIRKGRLCGFYAETWDDLFDLTPYSYMEKNYPYALVYCTCPSHYLVWLLNFVDILFLSCIFFSICFMCFCNSFYFANEEKLVP